MHSAWEESYLGLTKQPQCPLLVGTRFCKKNNKKINQSNKQIPTSIFAIPILIRLQGCILRKTRRSEEQYSTSFNFPLKSFIENLTKIFSLFSFPSMVPVYVNAEGTSILLLLMLFHLYTGTCLLKELKEMS